MQQEAKKGEVEVRDVFFGRAHPESAVGVMLAHGHHSRLLHYGTQTIPGDRHCEGCGATPGSEEAERICPAAEMIHIDIHREESAKILTSIAGPKAAKKVQRMFRRSVDRETHRVVDQRLQKLNDAIKPKPKYIPGFAWEWVKGLVLSDKIEL